jgi:hypothetical protein
VLSRPAEPDLSTGINAAGLRRRLVHHGPCAERVFELPRCSDLAAAATALEPVAALLAR